MSRIKTADRVSWTAEPSRGTEQSRATRIQFRVTPQELVRLEELAFHYDMSFSELVRYLVKRDHDTMLARERALIGLDRRDEAVIVALGTFPQDEEQIALRLSRFAQPMREIFRWLGERLEWLCTLGYVQKSLGGEYLLTLRGTAARDGLLESVPEGRRDGLASNLAAAFDETGR